MIILVGGVLGLAGYAFSLGIWYNTTSAYADIIKSHEKKIENLSVRDVVHDKNFVKIEQILDISLFQ